MSKRTVTGKFVESYSACFMLIAIMLIFFGVIDELRIYPEPFSALSFWLIIAVAYALLKNRNKLFERGLRSLTLAYLGWTLLDLAARIFLMFKLRFEGEFYHRMSFRAPFWILFGIWLLSYSCSIFKKKRESIEKTTGYSLGLSAKWVFKLSSLWCFLLLIFAILGPSGSHLYDPPPPLIEFRFESNQTLRVFPFSAELENRYPDIGFLSVKGAPSFLMGDKLDELIQPSFSLPCFGFLIFPAYFLLFPLTIYFLKKDCWKCLRAVTLLIAIAFFSIPIQLALQYGMPIFGSDGIIGHGFVILIIPLLLQFWSLFLPTNIVEMPVTAEPSLQENFDLPWRLAVVMASIALVWTISKPFAKRTNMEKLLIAAKTGQKEKFPIYLKKIEKELPDRAFGQTLCIAIQEDCLELVDWLLAQNPDLNDTSCYLGVLPLYYALHGGKFEIARKLLEAGADPNINLINGKSGEVAIKQVVFFPSHSRIKYVRLLASHGTNLNIPIGARSSSLFEYFMSSKDELSLLQELVRLGADPLKAPAARVFSEAALHPESDYFDFFCSAGLSPLKTDEDGNTFLHLLFIKVSKNLVFYDYLKPHAKKVINKKNNDGKTPLHLAVERNNPDLLEKMLALGAKDSISDNDGVTPRDLAEKKRYLRLLKIMDNSRN